MTQTCEPDASPRAPLEALAGSPGAARLRAAAAWAAVRRGIPAETLLAELVPALASPSLLASLRADPAAATAGLPDGIPAERAGDVAREAIESLARRLARDCGADGVRCWTRSEAESSSWEQAAAPGDTALREAGRLLGGELLARLGLAPGEPATGSPAGGRSGGSAALPPDWLAVPVTVAGELRGLALLLARAPGRFRPAQARAAWAAAAPVPAAPPAAGGAPAEHAETELVQFEFLSAVSHELRTPLSCVKNYVDMVLGGRAGSLTETQTRFLQTARRNVDRLTELIENLLTLSRSEELRHEGAADLVDLGELAAAAAHAHREEARARGVDLVLALPPREFEVRGDAERLGLALNLLLREAVRVCLRESRLVLSGSGMHREALELSSAGRGPLAAHPAWARVTVHVTRSDVSPAEAGELFRRFRPSREGGHRRPLAVSGLALAIARNLAEAHEGALWADPDATGGLRFELALPMSGPSPRRGQILERLHLALERARRHGRRSSICLVSLAPAGGDGSPPVPGPEGDVPLRAVWAAARRCLRSDDRIYLDPAANEMLLVLEGAGSDGVATVTGRLCRALGAVPGDAPLRVGEQPPRAGWAVFPQEALTPAELVDLARRRLQPLSDAARSAAAHAAAAQPQER